MRISLSLINLFQLDCTKGKIGNLLTAFISSHQKVLANQVASVNLEPQYNCQLLFSRINCRHNTEQNLGEKNERDVYNYRFYTLH